MGSSLSDFSRSLTLEKNIPTKVTNLSIRFVLGEIFRIFRIIYFFAIREDFQVVSHKWITLYILSARDCRYSEARACVQMKRDAKKLR